MTPNDPVSPETRDGRAAFEAFFGFIPPATLRFDGSGEHGLKVRYARVKIPVGQRGNGDADVRVAAPDAAPAVASA